MDNTLNSELFGEIDFPFNDMSSLVDFSTLPPFDFDSSTLSGHSMPDTPMAPCANMDGHGADMDFEPHQLNPQANPFETQASPDNAEIYDMLKLILVRIDQLETQVNHLGFNLDFALPKILNLSQDLKEPIDSLKTGLRTFTQGLVEQLVGDQQMEAEDRH